MQFTYSAYLGLIQRLREHGYTIVSYDGWKGIERCAILRHDIDNDPLSALKLARLEQKQGISSTYFVLVSSDFYNVFSRKSTDALREILSYGHEIGLHFDETRYPDVAGDTAKMREKILWEAQILEAALSAPVKCVSMHRPSQTVLDANIDIPGMINSYGREFFREFKYLSDSRRRWREPVDQIIASEQYPRLHILTHAFWYRDEPSTLSRTISAFIDDAREERYHILKENFTDLEDVYTAPLCWKKPDNQGSENDA